jgi:hypothetical protein
VDETELQADMNLREGNAHGREGAGGGVEGETSSPDNREEQGIFPGSLFFPLPPTSQMPHRGNLEEEEDEGETTTGLNLPPSSSLLQQFLTNYTQPREEPSQPLGERHRATALEDGWTAYMGRTITMRRVWQRMSNRSEMLLPSIIPCIGLNAYMRRLVQDSSRTFNPLTLLFLPQDLAVIRGRDQWIKSAWPLCQEVLTPAATPNALDTERLETER